MRAEILNAGYVTRQDVKCFADLYIYMKYLSARRCKRKHSGTRGVIITSTKRYVILRLIVVTSYIIKLLRGCSSISQEM